jgi:hypothetical protein
MCPSLRLNATCGTLRLKTNDDEIAAWPVGERLLDDRVYRALKPPRSGIGRLDMDKGRQ